jgi:hypothetical protein
MKPRSHRQRLSPPPCDEPFFNAGPIVPEPGADELIVALLGIDGRVLRAPAEGFQAPCEIMGVVAHTKLHQNQCPNPPERPPIRVKPGLQCPVLKPAQHLAPLYSRQPRRPARDGAILQTSHVALMLSKALSPPANRHATDAQLPRDLSLRDLASLQEPPRFEATFFTLCTSEVVWSPYHNRLV